MTEKKDPNKEVISEKDAALKADRPAVGTDTPDELRAGLATGSNASNPDQPDGHVIQTTTEGVNPTEPSTAENSVVLTAEGKKGPAA